MEIVGVLVGAAVAFLAAWQRDWQHAKRAEAVEQNRRRREIAEVYLPDMLDLLVALRWQSEDLESQPYDNPYPAPPERAKVPGGWYPQAIRLAHHPAVPAQVRTAAGELVAGIERWNAVVDDHESGEQENASLLSTAEQLVAALEAAGS